MLRVRAETLSLHGAGEHAPELARDLRDALARAGVTVRAP